MKHTGKNAPQASPRAIKQLALDLPVDFVLMLDAFCDAAWGAPRAKVIREAVTELVQRELEKNPGLKERFTQAEQRLRKERFTVVPINPRPNDEE
jgi:hypothetical protein